MLQSPAWGNFKSQFGWVAQQIDLGATTAQVLYRQLPLGLRLAYLPKGPAINWHDAAAVPATLTALKAIAAQPTTIFLKVEPDLADDAEVAQQFYAAGFQAGKTIQPPNTIWIDLTPDDEVILASMKSKTRYNIRLAQKKGVTVRTGSAADVALFHQLSQVTSERDGFGIHPLAYYQAAFATFAPDHCALLLAEYEGQPLAGLMVFAWGDRAYYLYGASNNEQRNLMPTYALQWTAMQWAKARGCRSYDLWGIPDADSETLEAQFQTRSDGLWGVYRFKRGFGGEVVRSIGAFDYVPRYQLHKRLIYRLFTQLWAQRGGD